MLHCGDSHSISLGYKKVQVRRRDESFENLHVIYQLPSASFRADLIYRSPIYMILNERFLYPHINLHLYDDKMLLYSQKYTNSIKELELGLSH